MWTFISFSLAIGINFLISEIQVNQISMVIDQKYLKQFGFPY